MDTNEHESGAPLSAAIAMRRRCVLPPPLVSIRVHSWFSKAAALCLGLAFAALGAQAAETIPAHQAQRIRAAAPGAARLAPKKARTVLLWNTPPALMPKDPHKGYCIPYGEEAVRALGEKTGAFKTIVSDDLAIFLPERLKQFDAIVLNNSSGPWIRPADADLEKFKAHGSDPDALEELLRQSLLDFVARGGGLVAIHYAIGANRQWPEFAELLGGDFTGHPWNEEIGVKVEEPAHPLVAAFEGKNFRIADEIYEFGKIFDRRKVRVLSRSTPRRRT